MIPSTQYTDTLYHHFFYSVCSLLCLLHLHDSLNTVYRYSVSSLLLQCMLPTMLTASARFPQHSIQILCIITSSTGYAPYYAYCICTIPSTQYRDTLYHHFFYSVCSLLCLLHLYDSLNTVYRYSVSSLLLQGMLPTLLTASAISTGFSMDILCIFTSSTAYPAYHAYCIGLIPCTQYRDALCIFTSSTAYPT